MSLVVPLNPDGIDYIVDVPGIDGEIVTKWFKWVHEKKKDQEIDLLQPLLFVVLFATWQFQSEQPPIVDQPQQLLVLV